MNAAASIQSATESVHLDKLIPDPDALACLSKDNAHRLGALPIALVTVEGRQALLVASAQASDESTHERVAKHVDAHLQILFIHCAKEPLASAIKWCYRSRLPLDSMLALASAQSYDQSTIDHIADYPIDLVNALLLQAVRKRASDIHFSPTASAMQVRMRIDGVLVSFAQLHKGLLKRIIVRLKIMASLDIAESRFAQDGQFNRFIDGHTIDFRVSTFPTVDGENTVLRLIDSQAQNHSLAALDLPADKHRTLSSLVQRPDGLIVVCGPTGAGKSTTLFALLAELDESALSIMTLEDPVEHRVPGIRQTTIDAARQWGYAEGLRALLRQDPDVLMLGEIRDAQSCAMALRAVSTGHQVLTTVHASCAHSALHRLRELNAANGALALSLVAIVAQRLVRKTCLTCHGNTDNCPLCMGTGFFGRQVIMEVLQITPAIRALIMADTDVEAIHAVSILENFASMHAHAADLVATGVTKRAEAQRVLGEDMKAALKH